MAVFQIAEQEGIPQAVQYIAAAGHSAPSADNSQPWCFEWSEQALSLKYFNANQESSLLDENDPATLMALGAVAQNMISAADGLGQKVQWSFPFRSSGTNVYLKGQFDGHHKQVKETDWEHAVFKRHTNRFAYTKQRISPSILAQLEDLSLGSASIKVFCERGQKKKVAELVKRAASVRFRLREVHEWFVKSLRFTDEEAETGDGLDVKTLPLPPGGRALLKFISPWSRMNRLNAAGLYKLFAHIEAQLIAPAPALVAIMAPLDRDALFDAGRLLEKAWCQLNAEGFAVHPYYVLSDQLTRYREEKMPKEFNSVAAQLEKETRDIIGTKGSSLQMLLRIGYPSIDAVNSKRRALNEALSQAITP